MYDFKFTTNVLDLGYVPVNGGIGLIKDITNKLRCQL